jgi:shikimate kinase
MKTLLDERAPVYASMATAVVDTDGLTPQEVASAVLAQLGEIAGEGGSGA